jgi:NAD-dependent deacetylase
MGAIEAALGSCQHFLAVGTSGVVYPAAGFVRWAAQSGAACTEINPEPTAGAFPHRIAQGAEVALPALVARWGV